MDNAIWELSGFRPPLQETAEARQKRLLVEKLRELEQLLGIPAIPDAESIRYDHLHSRVQHLSRVAQQRLSPADFEPHLEPITLGDYLKGRV